MTSTERQPDWEKIAQSLDGSGEPLSPAEAKVAEQTRDDLAWLGEQMPAKAPHEVLLRVGAKMSDALAAPARPKRSIRTLLLGSTAAAAAVAAIVLTILMGRPPAQTPTVVALTDEEAVAAFVADEPNAIDIQMDLLDEQVATLAADLELESAISSLDLEMDAVGEQIENFWLDPLATELVGDTEL